MRNIFNKIILFLYLIFERAIWFADKTGIVYLIRLIRVPFVRFIKKIKKEKNEEEK